VATEVRAAILDGHRGWKVNGVGSENNISDALGTHVARLVDIAEVART
jgi:hypothetical protein